MKYEVIKNQGKGYTLVISRDDGTRNDYRFNTKAQLTRWMKLAGIK